MRRKEPSPAKLLELCVGNLLKASKRAHAGDLLDQIGALLRRRYMQPLSGKGVTVYFDTEAEAKEFQRLVHSLPRRRK